MDVAALALSVDSKDVVAATADLDKFAKSADKAAASTGKMSGGGNTAKLAADYARAARAAEMASGSIARAADTVNRANSAMGAAAGASNAMRAANDNVTRSFTMADAQVNAYRNHLQQLVATQGAQTQAAAANAAANKAVGTQVAAVGVAGRATGVVMGGLAGIFGGVLGTAIGFVVSGLIEAAAEFFDTSKEADNLTKALDTTSFSTYALNDAQGILSGVFDLTTGKITTQSAALHDLARAQLLAAQAQSMGRAAEHNAYLTKVGQETGRTDRRWYQGGSVRDPKTGGYGLGWYAPTWEAKLAQGVQGGTMSARDAMRTLAGMQASGNIKPETFSKMLGAVTGIGLESENQKVYADALKSMESGKLAQSFVDTSRAQTRTPRAASGSRTAALSEEAKALQERTRATDQYITSLTDEVAKTGKSEEAVRRYEVVQALALATTDKQREAISRLSGERETALKLDRQTRETAEAQKALDAARAGMAGGIDIELQTMHLVGVEREREVLRIQRQIATIDLLAKIKKAEADGNTKLVDTYRQLLEVTDEDYSKQMQRIDGQQAIDQARELANIRTRGLESLNNGIVDAVMGVESLGSVFKKVANQIIADLLRIAIQRAIIEPLTKLLSGAGGGNPLGSFLGGLFADGAAFDKAQRFANGGTFTNSVVSNPTLFKFANGGKLGLMGEEGPEAIMPLGRLPNGKLGVHAQGGGGKSQTSVKMGDVTNVYKIEGAIMPDAIMAMIRQGGAATYEQMKRDLQGLLLQLDIDGAMPQSPN